MCQPCQFWRQPAKCKDAAGGLSGELMHGVRIFERGRGTLLPMAEGGQGRVYIGMAGSP